MEAKNDDLRLTLPHATVKMIGDMVCPKNLLQQGR
jgi:hypothetical protein